MLLQVEVGFDRCNNTTIQLHLRKWAPCLIVFQKYLVLCKISFQPSSAGLVQLHFFLTPPGGPPRGELRGHSRLRAHFWGGQFWGTKTGGKKNSTSVQVPAQLAASHGLCWLNLSVNLPMLRGNLHEQQMIHTVTDEIAAKRLGVRLVRDGGGLCNPFPVGGSQFGHLKKPAQPPSSPVRTRLPVRYEPIRAIPSLCFGAGLWLWGAAATRRSGGPACP